MTNTLSLNIWRSNKKYFVLLIMVWSISVNGLASAQDESLAEPFKYNTNLSGSMRGSLWGISNNYFGNDTFGTAELWLKTDSHIGHNTMLTFDGWARNVLYEGDTQGMLREGYGKFSNGDVDVSIGKQIIVWGRADQLNPTDNLSPRDNTLFMVESDDQRQGAVALKSNYSFHEIALTGIWIPYFIPNKQPLVSGKGATFSESIPEGSQIAFKLDQSGKTVDWSFSYFNGYDLNSDISIAAIQSGALILSLQHHKIQVLGMDVATVAGRYGLRAEAAYTKTEDLVGTDPFVKNPYFYGVLGADRTFYEYLNINFQYFMWHVFNYSDPYAISDPLIRSVAIQQAIASNQLDATQQGISLRISNKWLNETLEAEVTAVFNATQNAYFVAPKLRYSFDDHWKGTLGASVFRGSSDTLFGLLQDRSAVFAEVRNNF